MKIKKIKKRDFWLKLILSGVGKAFYVANLKKNFDRQIK